MPADGPQHHAPQEEPWRDVTELHRYLWDRLVTLGMDPAALPGRDADDAVEEAKQEALDTLDRHARWLKEVVTDAPIETVEHQPAESKVVDLMAALEQSVREAREARGRHA